VHKPAVSDSDVAAACLKNLVMDLFGILNFDYWNLFERALARLAW
jgi:hypothetical protein